MGDTEVSTTASTWLAVGPTTFTRRTVGVRQRRASIHVEIRGCRRELNKPRALKGRHVDAADPNLPSARYCFEIVEDALDAVPAKRTVEKEDGSDGDEPESLRSIPPRTVSDQDSARRRALLRPPPRQVESRGRCTQLRSGGLPGRRSSQSLIQRRRTHRRVSRSLAARPPAPSQPRRAGMEHNRAGARDRRPGSRRGPTAGPATHRALVEGCHPVWTGRSPEWPGCSADGSAPDSQHSETLVARGPRLARRD